MRLPDPGVGRDRDDEVHEVPAGRMAHPHAAQLDRLAQLAQRGADALVGVRGGDVHEHLHRLPQQAQGEGDHEAGDEDARHGVGRRLARRDEGHADQDGGGARQVRREVQGVGRERGRAVAARRAPARHHAARVDADHEHEHGDRPPRRLYRMGAAVDQAVQRLVADQQRDDEQHGALPQRGEVLGLAVPVVVLLVGRAQRHAHREQGQQRGDEIGARVRRLGEEGDGARREPRDELDGHEEDRAPPR